MMTETTARNIATSVMAAAGIAATYYVMRNPRLRRLARGAAVTALTTTLPAYLVAEVRRAWAESAPRS